MFEKILGALVRLGLIPKEARSPFERAWLMAICFPVFGLIYLLPLWILVSLFGALIGEKVPLPTFDDLRMLLVMFGVAGAFMGLLAGKRS